MSHKLLGGRFIGQASYLIIVLLREAAVLWLALTISKVALNAQNISYVGAEACGKCHAAQLATQSASAHAHALSPAARHPLAAHFVPATELLRPPRFHFQFRSRGGELRVAVSDGRDSMELPIEWAFGAGDQAVTFVSRVDADWYLEHYFTYYSSLGALAPTPGHEGYRSNTLELARGVLYRSVDPASGILKCFRCHCTGPPVIASDREIRPAEVGVRCEGCHGPGSRHVEAASAGRASQSLIQNPGRLSASEINLFCGGCHRSPEEGPLSNTAKAWNVRHQPISLSRSGCFLKSQEKLSCLTCHDPHAKLNRDSASYDRKCASCHGAVRHHSAGEVANCISCHMPQVSPQPHLAFTNHWIGVYSEDNALVPRPQ